MWDLASSPSYCVFSELICYVTEVDAGVGCGIDVPQIYLFIHSLSTVGVPVREDFTPTNQNSNSPFSLMLTDIFVMAVVAVLL